MGTPRFIAEEQRIGIKILKIIGLVIVGMIGAVVFAFLFGYFVMLLWNWLMPMIFGLTEITFWQAVGIVILARLIFGGFKHKDGDGDKKWEKKWKNKCKDEGKNWAKWKYYEEYWKERGEKDFDDFVELKSQGKKEGE